MFGGSGSHNDLIFNRGNPRVYDNYAEILNDSSWKYENVLKYFKRAETFIGQLFNDTNGGTHTAVVIISAYFSIFFKY